MNVAKRIFPNLKNEQLKDKNAVSLNRENHENLIHNYVHGGNLLFLGDGQLRINK